MAQRCEALRGLAFIAAPKSNGTGTNHLLQDPQQRPRVLVWDGIRLPRVLRPELHVLGAKYHLVSGTLLMRGAEDGHAVAALLCRGRAYLYDSNNVVTYDDWPNGRFGAIRRRYPHLPRVKVSPHAPSGVVTHAPSGVVSPRAFGVVPTRLWCCPHAPLVLSPRSFGAFGGVPTLGRVGPSGLPPTAKRCVYVAPRMRLVPPHIPVEHKV